MAERPRQGNSLRIKCEYRCDVGDWALGVPSILREAARIAQIRITGSSPEMNEVLAESLTN